MLNNFIQDPENLSYEKLFFFLTSGKYDTQITTNNNECLIEEFAIVDEPWKDHISYLEQIIPILTQRFIRDQRFQVNLKENTAVDFHIYFVIYSTPDTGRLIGLAIRIVSPNIDLLTTFSSTPEDRLQKSMYLLSRGLLWSAHHRIDQITCPIPL
ncbi:MAG: hypothetical protein ACXAC8_13195 [Candidatus Hodarchaeales archaeon]|jgi:hypothetical protein